MDCGTVFRITPSGALTTLYTFCSQPNCTDGMYPYAPLVQASDGNFYGTTEGFDGYGTVFKITTSGVLTTLHNFDGTDGANPWGGVMQASDGFLYGTTGLGGPMALARSSASAWFASARSAGRESVSRTTA